jgi:hypothetical protein
MTVVSDTVSRAEFEAVVDELESLRGRVRELEGLEDTFELLADATALEDLVASRDDLARGDVVDEHEVRDRFAALAARLETSPTKRPPRYRGR